MEILDIDQLAALLSRDTREVGKLADRGKVPGRKVNGQWRFARAEINHWLETRLHEYDADQLRALETTEEPQSEPLLLSSLFSESLVSVPLPATTRSSVLRELVKLAEQSWQVYDAEAVLTAITERETMQSTSLLAGVAIPHAHRPLGDGVLGEPIVAFAKTARAIPFGGDKGMMTDLFFLVLSKDYPGHLRVMARLARLFLLEGFLDGLRNCETSLEAFHFICEAEQSLRSQMENS
jgi:PTS system nitrogen regulatory IIA component